MATIPMYDITTMPCITYPMDNTVAQAKKYLGGYAITGKTRASVNLAAKNDAEMEALYSFWRVDCNYGVEPFLIPIPIFGNTVANPEAPSLLVKFKSDLKASKQTAGWTVKIDVEVFGLVLYIVDDQGQFITSDDGEYKLTADGNYVPTGNVINSYRGVVYA